MKKAAEGSLKAYFGYNDKPLVSKDFNGCPKSSVFDATLTDVIGGKFVKVFSWYDNEWGYSNRVIDLAVFVGKKGL